jgi:hypothetical protein
MHVIRFDYTVHSYGYIVYCSQAATATGVTTVTTGASAGTSTTTASSGYGQNHPVGPQKFTTYRLVL